MFSFGDWELGDRTVLQTSYGLHWLDFRVGLWHLPHFISVSAALGKEGTTNVAVGDKGGQAYGDWDNPAQCPCTLLPYCVHLLWGSCFHCSEISDFVYLFSYKDITLYFIIKDITCTSKHSDYVWCSFNYHFNGLWCYCTANGTCQAEATGSSWIPPGVCGVSLSVRTSWFLSL